MAIHGYHQPDMDENHADIPTSLKDIPISSLRSKTRGLLSVYLNPRKILPSENGHQRDWRGVFHFTGLPSQRANYLANTNDQFGELLRLWSEETENPASLGQLQQILGYIDRWDVLDDTAEMFSQDAMEYIIQKAKIDKQNASGVSTATAETPKITFSAEQNILTIDDTILAQKGLPPQQYDAFILFADEDIDFATEMIDNMEATGLKICVKERDLLGGISFEHDAIRRLLTDRCNRLIVILSPSFIISPANEFISNLAQSLGITERRRKIIPCLYEECDLPEIFKHMHLLNYQRSKKFNNFWERLNKSLYSTPQENPLPKITITTTDSIYTSPEQRIIGEPSTSTPIETLPDVNRFETHHLDPEKFNNNKQTISRSSPSTPNLLKKFLHIEARRRTSSSQSLNTLDCEPNNNNQLLCPLSNDHKKKRKWYSKLLPELSGSDSKLNECSKSKKKIWFRKKVATHS